MSNSSKLNHGVNAIIGAFDPKTFRLEEGSQNSSIFMEIISPWREILVVLTKDAELVGVWNAQTGELYEEDSSTHVMALCALEEGRDSQEDLPVVVVLDENGILNVQVGDSTKLSTEISSEFTAVEISNDSVDSQPCRVEILDEAGADGYHLTLFDGDGELVESGYSSYNEGIYFLLYSEERSADEEEFNCDGGVLGELSELLPLDVIEELFGKARRVGSSALSGALKALLEKEEPEAAPEPKPSSPLDQCSDLLKGLGALGRLTEQFGPSFGDGPKAKIEESIDPAAALSLALKAAKLLGKS